MPTIDPYRQYCFLIEFDGIIRAGFQECSGLDTSLDAIAYREGNDPLITRQLPGLTKFSHITLKWGMTNDRELYDWCKTGMDGNVQRKNGSIVQLDQMRNEVKRWNIQRAWITKWTGPSFNAKGTDLSIETVEIVHEGVELA